MLELIVECDRPLSNWNLRKDNTDQHKVLPNAKLPTVVHWRENSAGKFLYTVHFHMTCGEDIRCSLYSSAWIRKWWQMKTSDLCGLRSVMLLKWIHDTNRCHISTMFSNHWSFDCFLFNYIIPLQLLNGTVIHIHHYRLSLKQEGEEAIFMPLYPSPGPNREKLK